ncbi:MAG: Hsp20/alpha crystallin family protein [Patescibacteria group bacterium]|nr:Hsp20/alpha crystallin family protein [Patescibacteria group bacterium]
MAIVRRRPTLSWPWFFEDWELPETIEQQNMDIYETEDAVVVEAPVPGIEKENIDITIEEGVIRIKAEKEEKTEEEEEGKEYHARRSKRSYYYQAALPSRGEWDNAEAEVKDGMVTVRVPKAEEVKPKKIEVK